MVSSSDILNAKVLVVDDQEANVLLLERMLRGAGYTSVASTMDPHEVCELHRKNRYGLILLDLQMPGMDGFQVMEGLKEIETGGYLPVLVITAQPDHKLRALQAGAKDFVSKPLDLAEVLMRVYNMLEVRLLHLETKNYSKVLEELNQSEKMASLGRLVAGVAHEINSPLGVINSNNDLISRALPALRNGMAGLPPCPETQEVLDLLEVLSNTAEVDRIACQRLIDLVKNLKNFARLDEADRKSVDIHEGLDSTLRLVRYQFKDRIRVEKDYGELPPIECHPNQLNQVFMNILLNAGEAIEGEGVIRITTRVLDGNLVITISDTGKGIPAGDLGRIFDPGFTTKGAGVGTGLGLSITYKIVQNHGGTIQAESQAGKGTMFTITLPVR